MAWTAIKDDEYMQERYDDDVTLNKKLDQLAAWIKQSKHFVIFTGAGISTSAGIPDFRGPQGVWTLQAQGKTRTAPTTPTIKALPTTTHMSIVKLQEEGILKYLISQNCDGIHRRSGVHPSKMSELHGNGNIEECEKCGKRYLRDLNCYRISRGKDHFTGRFCSVPKCHGRLLEWTIDFGQNLPVEQLERGFDNAGMSDLHLVLGSSLTVSPACDMPKQTAKNGGRLVIGNLQKTPLHRHAALAIHAPCDVIMKGVMERLGLEIPKWKLHRKIIVEQDFDTENQKWHLNVQGVDPNDSSLPATLFRSKDFKYADQKWTKLENKWYPITDALRKSKAVKLQLHCMRHYGEPPVKLVQPLSFGKRSSTVYSAVYDITTGTWETAQLDVSVTAENSPQLTFHEISGALVPFSPEVNRSPRMWHAAVLHTDSKGKKSAVVFGGAGARDNFPGIEIFDLATCTWSRPDPKNFAGRKLPYIHESRWGHSACIVPAWDPNKVVLFGGWDSSAQYNDLYTFDCNTHEIAVLKTGPGPTPRAGHSAIACGKKMVVFGGAYCKGGPYVYSDNTYILDLETMSWSELETVGEIPNPRAQHGSCLMWNRFLLVFGGYSGDWVLNGETFCLDLKLKLWHRVKLSGDLPVTTPTDPTNFRVEPVRPTCEVVDDDNVLIYGLGGIFLFTMSTCTINALTIDNMPKLVAHIMCKTNDKQFLVFGGYDLDKKATMNTLYKIDFH